MVDQKQLIKDSKEVLEFYINLRNDAYRSGRSFLVQKFNESIENTLYIIKRAEGRLNGN